MLKILKLKNIYQPNIASKRKSLLLRKIAQLNWTLFTHLQIKSNTMSWIARDKVDATLKVFENKPELTCFGIWSREDLSSINGVTLGVSLPSNAD